MMDKERRWFVGIDWGSQEHVVSLYDEDGNKIGQRKFPHGGTGLTDMIAWLLQASGGKPGEIHVAIETPHGPIVEALLDRPHRTAAGARDPLRALHLAAVIGARSQSQKACDLSSVAELTIVDFACHDRGTGRTDAF